MFAQFIVNIWSLPLKLLPMGLSTVLGSLQMPEQSWIYSSENWGGKQGRGVFKESLLYFSHFTVNENKNQIGSVT